MRVGRLAAWLAVKVRVPVVVEGKESERSRHANIMHHGNNPRETNSQWRLIQYSICSAQYYPPTLQKTSRFFLIQTSYTTPYRTPHVLYHHSTTEATPTIFTPLYVFSSIKTLIKSMEVGPQLMQNALSVTETAASAPWDEVHTAGTAENPAGWGVTSCILVEVYRRFEGTCCLLISFKNYAVSRLKRSVLIQYRVQRGQTLAHVVRQLTRVRILIAYIF
jgi:hypothetical protein